MASERILIVEDEELIAFSLSKLLRTHGYDVEVAMTVASAMSALDAAAGSAMFQHVLLDLKLPDADGENVLAHVERMERRPRVVVTASPDSLDGHRILSLRGRCEFLPKPLIVETLLTMLAESPASGVDAYAEEFLLSPQEHVVVRHAVAGLDDLAISAATDCSRSTVKSYWSRIYQKLGVKGRDQVLAHLARWLMSNRPRKRASYRPVALRRE